MQSRSNSLDSLDWKESRKSRMHGLM